MSPGVQRQEGSVRPDALCTLRAGGRWYDACQSQAAARRAPEHEAQPKQGQQAEPKAAHIILQPLQVRAARQQPHACKTEAGMVAASDVMLRWGCRREAIC